jgi:hypothetical protein
MSLINALGNSKEIMKLIKITTRILFVVMLCVLAIPQATADEHNKKTRVTFTEPVEVPGAILPPGNYTFALMDSLSDRNIVQISNEDQTKIFATILAINNYRLTPTGKTVLTFSERPSGTPEALHAWFYPGDNFGQEFVYTKSRAHQLAPSNKIPVLALRAEAVPDVASLKEVPLVAVIPDNAEVPVAEVVQPQPETFAVAQPPAQLPKTASSLSIFITIALACLLIGVIMRAFSKAPTDLSINQTKE